jgi:hypothetical protein
MEQDEPVAPQETPVPLRSGKALALATSITHAIKRYHPDMRFKSR